MIVYFDTSAFVPLLVAEPGSALCRRLWQEADHIVTSRLLYVEAAAALARAQRLGRLTVRQHQAMGRTLDRLWAEFGVAEIDEDLVGRAATLAHSCALRGFDAVHCAAAERFVDPDLVAASGDQRLLEAWRHLGVATADVNAGPSESSR